MSTRDKQNNLTTLARRLRPFLLNQIASSAYSGEDEFDDSDVSNPPTSAQLVTAFGSAAALGAGFGGLLSDDGLSQRDYHVGADTTALHFSPLVKSRLATTSVQATNAASALTTPTSDATGEAIHPSVVDTYVTLGPGETWNGYRYWMAMTPFAGGDIAVENPEILVSADGDTWVVPGGLTNPIATPVLDHLADTELILAQDNKLYCYYIDVDEASPDVVTVKVKSSSDGTTWSSATSLITGNDTNASPAVIWDGSQYVMWYVNYSASPYTLKKRTCATPDGTWSSESACTVNNIPGGFNIWNIYMVKRGDEYHAFIGMEEDPKPIYFATSADGDTWAIASTALLQVGAAGAWDDGFLYRGCGTITEYGYDFWYSANDQLASWNNPHIGRTSVYLDNLILPNSSRVVIQRDTTQMVEEFSGDLAEIIFAWDTTTARLRVYVGGQWVEIGGGDVAADTIWDAKGDLAVGTGANAASRLAVGSNGQALVADSTQATGIKWGSAAGTGYTEGARVYHNADQGLTSGAVKTIAFNSEVYDTDTIHDTSTNNERLTCVTAGKYAVSFQGVLSAAGTGSDNGFWIEHDSRGRVAQQSCPNLSSVTLGCIIDLAVNDYLVVKVYLTGASPNLIYSGTNEYSPFFEMQRIG